MNATLETPVVLTKSAAGKPPKRKILLIDDDPASSNNVRGLFGLQIEGFPSKVSFRNLWLKKIS